MDKQERSSPSFEMVVTAQRAPSGVQSMATSEELELARQAYEQFADQEMMADIYNRLNQNVAPGGIFGLLPYLGQSRDGGARFKNVTVVPGSMYDPNREALYRREGVGQVDKQGFALNEQGGFPTYSQVLIDRGLEPLRPGEIFLQQYADSAVAEDSKDIVFGKPVSPGLKRPGEAAALTHEFVHRGFNSAMYRDFADWAKENLSEKDADIIEKPLKRSSYNEDLAYTIGRLAASPRGESPEEAYDDGSYYRYNDRQLGIRTKKELHSEFVEDLETIDKGLREFLTPERLERYNLRMPIRSLPPEKPEEPEQEKKPLFNDRILQAVLDRLFN